MSSRALCILSLVCCLMGCSESPSSRLAERVPFVRLLAQPQAYDGKLITTTGFMHLEFEGDSLYQNRNDHALRLRENALWISLPELESGALSAFKMQYVEITGVFNAESHGHGGLYSGTIHDVDFLVIRSVGDAAAMTNVPFIRFGENGHVETGSVTYGESQWCSQRVPRK